MEEFDAVAMHVAWAVPPGSRFCEIYTGVEVLVLTALLYHHCMSKVGENDDYDDYGICGFRLLI